ncbi:MAG: hypothetical protein J6T74_09225 [Clostridia bacterium]|nr:hypothetical protein [Clostridia bacterium]
MEIIKKKAKKSIKNKQGKDIYPMHYFIVTENGNYILIKPVFTEDYARLDMVARYAKD